MLENASSNYSKEYTKNISIQHKFLSIVTFLNLPTACIFLVNNLSEKRKIFKQTMHTKKSGKEKSILNLLCYYYII
jgi:hypothetical protein